MNNKLKFKNNTEFIIPLIIKNRKLCNNNAFIKAEIKNIGIGKILILYYKPISTEQYKWLYVNLKKEKLLYNIFDDLNNIYITIANFLIPSGTSVLISPIEMCGKSLLSNSDIINIMHFWGDFGKILLCE